MELFLEEILPPDAFEISIDWPRIGVGGEYHLPLHIPNLAQEHQY